MNETKVQDKENKVLLGQDKTRELIILLSELSEGDNYFGATKLNKLLFFSDFLSYLHYGKSISGSKYEARPEGPMLKGFYELRDQMVGKDIVVRPKGFWGYVQHKTLALRSADISNFSAEEMNIIIRVVNEYRDLSASQISALSHEFLGWQAVDFGEEIPYETALVSTRDLTLDEYEFPEYIDIKFENCTIDASSLGD